MDVRRATAAVLLQLILGAVSTVAFSQQVTVDALIPNCGDGAVDLGEQCDGSADAACPGMCTAHCACPPATTVDIPSAAQPPNTPGSPGVVVTNAKLLTQLGPQANLNHARYTRFALDDSAAQPDAILILIPGFEGGAANFRILAQNLLKRVKADHNLRLEVWAFDRRTNQLEDTEGLDIAEAAFDPILAGNWLFGDELSLPLDPRLPRRAVFYNAHDEVPFLANWTNLVFSRDIDAVVDAALAVARNKNVFLGGHSAGTGFTARYAASDFNTAPGCAGAVEAGYAKLRGLVLLEGGGGSTTGASAITDDTLDRIIARFDGGLYGAVRDNAPRCVDGVTKCTVKTEATDCAGQTPPKCTLPTTAYSLVPGALNPRVLASSEATALQSPYDLNTHQIVGQLDLGAPGNNPVKKVPDLAGLALVPPATVEGGFGTFLDKKGAIAKAFPFLAMSIGEPGPVVDGILTWKDILHGPFTGGPDLGPPPTALPAGPWGMGKEVTRLDRVLWAFFAGRTNFSDWYYPNAGPSTTAGIDLDSTKLSAPPPAGRGRCDIENLTQAAAIDIPVIAFSASQGLATVPGDYVPFAQSIGKCTTGECDGSTPRVVDAQSPNAAFPSFGGPAGGFEVFVNEGFAHLDIVTAEDNADNNVVGPLSNFITRNAVLSVPCAGDCDGNGAVSVDEVVRGVNILLGIAPIDQCPAFDCHGTGVVSIDCLVQGVSRLLEGCPLMQTAGASTRRGRS
jgi:pimeloyl-ACP methyl ester carboxylesterase